MRTAEYSYCFRIRLCKFAYCPSKMFLSIYHTWIILCMGSANKRRRYYVALSLIGVDHTRNDPWLTYGNAMNMGLFYQKGIKLCSSWQNGFHLEASLPVVEMCRFELDRISNKIPLVARIFQLAWNSGDNNTSRPIVGKDLIAIPVTSYERYDKSARRQPDQHIFPISKQISKLRISGPLVIKTPLAGWLHS